MDDLFIGTATRGWGDLPLWLSVADRRQHVMIVGQTGVGKSTLLKSLIVQDIRAGRGCAVLDPHGDLAEELLAYVPRHRIDDVVYFDPAELARAPALNPIAMVPPDERSRVVEEVVAVFAAIWGLSHETTPRLLYILTNTVAALLELPNGASLLGVPRMLTDERYRRFVVRHVGRVQVRRFWEEEFAGWPERMRSEACAAVLNKVEMLLLSPALHNVLGQVRPTIRPQAIMDEGRVFIANLSKGRLGETTAQLLGALLVTSFDLAARRRAGVPEEERRDFALYADEFQNFSSERFVSILSEARKYRLGLTLATQYTAQVSHQVRAALLGNVGTVISFRVGDEDARLMERVLHPLPASFLRELGRGEIVARLVERGMAAEARAGKTARFPFIPSGRAQMVIEQSNRRYTRARGQVEGKLLRWLGDR